MRPFYMPPNYMMNQIPVPPRFPMYAQPFTRAPFASQMPMPMPPQMPAQAVSGAPRLESLIAGANSLFTNAQRYTPYIQQAAPMFKNLPALWRLYRGFKDSPDPLESSIADTSTPSIERRSSRTSRSQQQSAPLTPRPSLPMIFQPPFN